jgi:D-alanine-D-alanine ligase
MARPRVAVLRGGPSDEYDVSLRTGSAVLESIDTNEFEPLDIVITRGGEWLHDGRTRYPENIIPAVDVVFIALHGTYGEDGTLQRLLDRFGVPYTGSGAYASGLAMHKGFTKDHLKGTGILLPQHFIIQNGDGISPHRHAGRIREQFGPEYVIKPVSSGSSVGVSLVFDTLTLGEVIAEALTGSHEIIVEEYIRGREVTCGVIERFRNHELYALPAIEIVPPPSALFFNNNVKYNGETQEICPTSFSQNEKRAIEEATKRVHTELNLRQYSRSDFIHTPHGLYFLEVNTLPGLSKESLMPKALTAVGSSHKEFVAHLINDALAHS